MHEQLIKSGQSISVLGLKKLPENSKIQYNRDDEKWRVSWNADDLGFTKGHIRWQRSVAAADIRIFYHGLGVIDTRSILNMQQENSPVVSSSSLLVQPRQRGHQRASGQVLSASVGKLSDLQLEKNDAGAPHGRI